MGRSYYSKCCPSNHGNKLGGRAELGAEHHILFETDKTKSVDPNGFEVYFGLLSGALNEAIPGKPVTSHSWDKRRIPQHRILNGIASLSFSIAEISLIKKQGRKHNVHWSKRQLRMISDRIGDEISQLDVPTNPGGTMTAVLSEVEGIPGGSAKERQMAANVDPASPVGRFMVAEHEIILEHLSHYMPGIKHPTGFKPQVPIAAVNRDAEVKAWDGIVHKREAAGKVWGRSIAAAQNLLPIIVEFDPIRLYSSEMTQI
jgi:hypothetical protein